MILDLCCSIIIFLILWWSFKRGFLGIILDVVSFAFASYTFSITYNSAINLLGVERSEFVYILSFFIYYYVLSYILFYIFDSIFNASSFATDSILGLLLGGTLLFLGMSILFVFINFIFNIKSLGYTLDNITFWYLSGDSVLLTKINGLLFDVNEKYLPYFLYNSFLFTFFIKSGKYILLSFFKTSFSNLFLSFIRQINL